MPEDRLTEVYESDRAVLTRVAALILDSSVLAHDVVADAYLAVSQTRTEIRDLSGYLRKTVVNGALGVVHSNEAERRTLARVDASNPPMRPPEDLVDLRLALRALPDKQRVAVVLKYFVDLPEREIADVLHCRPATVRSHLHRAMTRLPMELVHA